MTNIFIIDDSILYRKKITSDLESHTDITVVGTANDVMMAQKKLNLLKTIPDIIILDVELPQIDGLTFLKDVLSTLNTKVIVCTSYYNKYREKAISLGAMAVIDKEQININCTDILLQNIQKVQSRGIKKSSAKINIVKPNTKIIAIGASTGGLEVLESVISKLPSKIPPILIVQHMGRDIIPTFIPKIQATSHVQIKEAKNGEYIEENTVYFAPFNKHLTIKKESKNKYILLTNTQDKVSYHRPSIDMLFNSVANEAQSNSVGFILTGMGYDGVAGISKIKENGGKTFAQNEQSSKVFGMPKAAIEANVIDKVICQDEIAGCITTSYLF